MFKEWVILSYVYQYGIPFVYVAFNFKLLRKISGKQLFIIGCLVLLLFLSVLYPTLHNTGDYSYVKVSTFVFRKLAVYLFLAMVLVKKYREHTGVEHFMYYYILTHAVFVIGTILIVFAPGLKSIWFSVFAETIESETLLESYGYTFRIGWQGFAGYRMTLHCNIICIMFLRKYVLRPVRISYINYNKPDCCFGVESKTFFPNIAIHSYCCSIGIFHLSFKKSSAFFRVVYMDGDTDY